MTQKRTKSRTDPLAAPSSRSLFVEQPREELADVRGEDGRLLHRREVSPGGHLRVALNIVGALRPRKRGLLQVSREQCQRGRDDVLSRRFPGSADTERIHDQMCRQIEDVLTRAQEAGEVRPDVTPADIIHLIWSNGRMIDATSVTAPNAWRCHLYLMLDAHRAECAHPIPEPPITVEQLYDAMVQLGTAD